MRMDKDWCTVKEVEEQLDISRPTIYRYIDNHSHYLNTKKVDNTIFIHRKSIEVIIDIREQYEQGKRKKQIEEYLKNKSVPLHITVHDNNVRTLETEGLDEIRSLVEASTRFIVHAMNEKLDQQQREHDNNMRMLKEEHEKLIEQLTGEIQDSKKEIQILKKDIDNQDDKRDRQLMTLIRDMQETKKMIAAAEQKQSWFSKLFGTKK